MVGLIVSRTVPDTMRPRLVQTRQRQAIPKMAPPRGIVGARDGVEPLEFHHSRYLVAWPLERAIEHWWTVRWAMAPGTEQVRSTLGHPSFHVSIDGGHATVVGVVRGRFNWRLHGSGSVFSAKFRPGAFRGLLGSRPASAFTDRVVPLGDVVGDDRARALQRSVADASDDDGRVAAATAFFVDVLPPLPGDHDLLMGLVQRVTSDRTVTSVEALGEHCGLPVRELQRWFSDVVGITPKWMIRRYRLHDALSALDAGDTTVARVAADLGYADQSHFARDFKSVVGLTPSGYLQGRR